MSANLTNTYIANTYQKILQIDDVNGADGVASFDIEKAVTTDKYNLLNGFGNTVPGFVIDTRENGNGGMMFKDGSGLWSIQASNTALDESGLNFWRPNAGDNDETGNAKLFLKNTGTVWVGYQNNNNPVIPTDEVGYSLYVKDGLMIGDTSGTTKNGQLKIDGEYPFRFYRYKIESVGEGNYRRYLRDKDNNKFKTSEWVACVVGFKIDYNGDRQINYLQYKIVDSGSDDLIMIEVGTNTAAGAGGEFDAYFDILLIKKGIYSEYRKNGGDEGLDENYENGAISIQS